MLVRSVAFGACQLLLYCKEGRKFRVWLPNACAGGTHPVGEGEVFDIGLAAVGVSDGVIELSYLIGRHCGCYVGRKVMVGEEGAWGV